MWWHGCHCSKFAQGDQKQSPRDNGIRFQAARTDQPGLTQMPIVKGDSAGLHARMRVLRTPIHNARCNPLSPRIHVTIHPHRCLSKSRNSTRPSFKRTPRRCAGVKPDTQGVRGVRCKLSWVSIRDRSSRRHACGHSQPVLEQVLGDPVHMYKALGDTLVLLHRAGVSIPHGWVLAITSSSSESLSS